MTETSACGAIGPHVGYRCTRPTGHDGGHAAVVAGDVASAWTADTGRPNLAYPIRTHGQPTPEETLMDLTAVIEAGRAAVAKAFTPLVAETIHIKVFEAFLDGAAPLISAKAWDEGKRAGVEQMRPTNPYRGPVSR